MAPGDLNILMVIEGEIATTQLIEQVLAACADHGIRYRKRLLEEMRIADISSNTIPLFIRCAGPSVKFWVELLTEAQYPYLFYIDDNFWKLEGESPLVRYYQHAVVRRSLETAVGNAHTVITNSRELAGFVSRFNDRVVVLPAFFDFDLIDDVVAQPTDEIRIGFAGSSSRSDDLDIVAPIIAPLLEGYPAVVFEFAGVLPNAIKPTDRIRFFPYIGDYREFIRFQAGRKWAIGLAPLADHEANRCKTDNKYREYGACGIAGVYSAISPYIYSVQDGVTGLLVDNSTSSWFNAVADLIANPTKRRMLGETARSHIRQQYCVRSIARCWAECFREVGRALNDKRFELSSSHLSLRKRMSGLVGKMRLRIAIAYYEGGFVLVLKRSIQCLSRIAAYQVFRRGSTN